MSFFQSAILLAQAVEDSPAPDGPEYDWFSAPTFFLAFIGLCLMMIVIGAIVDRMPEREDTDDSGGPSKADKRKAKMEAKAKKKSKASKKSKTAKKGKGKGKKGKKAKKGAEPEEETLDSEVSEPSDFEEMFTDPSEELTPEDDDAGAGVEESIEFSDDDAGSAAESEAAESEESESDEPAESDAESDEEEQDSNEATADDFDFNFEDPK